MAQPKVAIRLGTEGKDDVTRDFRAVGDAGDAAAARASKAFDKAASDFESAERRMASAAQKISAFMPQTAVQMRINDKVGSNSTLDEGSARVSAAAFRELFAEQERVTAGAAALRAQLDPTWAAQQRFNNEMGQARTLIAANAITLDEYCDKLRLERAALDQVSQSHGQATSTAGAMRAGMQNLGFQAQDFIVQVLGGTDALRAFAMQAPQAIGAVQMMANSTESGNSKFAAMANVLSGPVGIALGIAIPLAIMLGEKLLSGGDAADSMAQRQSVLAGFIDQTTGRLKEQNQALIQNQVLLTKTDAVKAQSGFNDARRSLSILRPGDADLANIAKFAANTGQTSRAAQMLTQLTKEKPWLAGQAESMNSMLADMTSQARLVVQSQAQSRLLTGGGRPGDQKRAFGDFSSGSAPSYNMTEVNAQAKLAAAVTGVDKAQAQLTLTRAKAEEQLKSGAITQQQATAQIAAAERELNQAQDAQQKASAARSASRRAQTKEEREQDRLREEAARKVLALEKERNAWANNQNIGGASRDALTADGDKIAERQKAFRAANDDISAGNVLLNLEWELRGKSRDEIQKTIELKRYLLDLERDERNLTAEQVIDLVNTKDAQLTLNQLIEQHARNWSEVTEFGRSFVDTVLSPDAWSSWGNLGKTILRELQNEMMKLALINPIKNALFGDGLPTLTSALGTLFGGRAANGGSAIGNMYTPAGSMLVGENGPEIVNMPRGAQVLTASDSRRMLQGPANDRGDTHVHVYADNALVTDQIVSMISQGMDVASVRGAAGGAAMSESQAAARGRRQMGRSWR
ncbi:hypothetical protein [Sphingobium sp. Z007]|uniref:hypothetical protein n=1 Tax=Sphingobium sp. Z007 TaxID=627495 RepID=UPI000B49D5FB|nr:hypothetical protein [Sphingobium sp. Z007]